MRRKPVLVLGIAAPRARPTLAAAFWLASAVSIPVGAVLITIEGALRIFS
ncbi:hypothetical protein [Mangrovicoccus ximenensis]|nr:hypothetical protein [Mangrovicoccus ximenensis]